ncbi:hypothetical protein MNBD_GAMMA16-1423 [hydrothermal vent metagenome]|uniref:Uncharacterized protein n=1 Tax=hydrothermal vent metagenome TaxID=652676 RepID=A0A3B0Z2S1_9ZZZZ
MLSGPTYLLTNNISQSINDKRDETLASYYLRTYSHLVPEDLEFRECDDLTKMAIPMAF